MFNESWPWKRDLGRTAERLEGARLGLGRRLDQLGRSDESYEEVTEALYEVERDVMAGSFAARRLLGMPSKVTKGARATTAVVGRFSLRQGANPPDPWEALGDLEMYDMGRPRTATISANELCNLFVHSVIFRTAWTLEGLAWEEYWALPEDDPQVEAEPTELVGLLVATDKSCRDHVTLVSLEELVRVFRALAEDEVTQLKSRRDHKGRVHVTAT